MLRFCLLLISCVLALFWGFFTLEPLRALGLFSDWGYFWIAACFCLFLFLAFKQLKPALEYFFRQDRGKETLWSSLLIAACSAYCIASAPWGYRIVTDEPLLMATAHTMAQEASVFVPQRAFYEGGQLNILDTSIDKRPILYPFFVSLLHVILGATSENGSLLNNLLCPVFFCALYAFLRAFLTPVFAACALVFMCALPLMPEVVNGRGMEPTMLVMLVVTALCAQHYLKAPTRLSLSTLCLSTLLLAQSRYEMALFVPFVGGIILLGWWQSKRMIIPNTLLLLPLLFVPQAWQHDVFKVEYDPFQLQEAKLLDYWQEPTGGFSAQYFGENLKNTFVFLFTKYNKLQERYPSSAVLSAMGLMGVLYGFYALFGQKKRFLQWDPALKVSALLGVGVLLSFILHMLYIWGRMDLSVTYRFSLLFSIVGLIAFACALQRVKAYVPYMPRVAVGLACLSLAHTGFYTLSQSYATRFFGPLSTQFLLDCIYETRHEHPLYIGDMPYLAIQEGAEAFSCDYALKHPEAVLAFEQRHPGAPVYAFLQCACVGQQWIYEKNIAQHDYKLHLVKRISTSGPASKQTIFTRVRGIPGRG